MNLPNKLTMFRVILIPFFVICLLVPAFQNNIGQLVALIIFIVASLTDMADGKIARKYNLVTNFGKFMDPLADKLLVCSAMICLVSLDDLPGWVVVIIIAREFVISGFRLIASDNNVVIAASMWGKVKTVFQMGMIILILLNFSCLPTIASIILHAIIPIVIGITVVLTIVSLIDYLIKNKEVLKEQK
ncbi:CDP-diacylglycerol--glycerol-3-phosphate 3-phosphatidyltransferase [Eubacterium oxidoreducens]|uniref:CDP-diacylglycerol--glycerol-3-phosphate 3-phosphatidyltransferase n=1 Tax=Eubacterium oxidoreducens TaxID=1732 RepID=A0A1G6AMC2_EUBOX|nr:CDP-diacylglycerol--glycerol-3-phosphate 3-phosphatidyltransferase [Eubacterium oxidoreducens]SDB09546.1 CDP-diacylglycerol--glycerol-3-phosphate 3-phosphatidyltransferase [Eubacterium oxidoreducens]